MQVKLHTSNPALDGLSPRDRNLFCDFGAGPSQKPDHPTIISAFEHCAHAYPNAIAATTVNPDASLNTASNITYAKLNKQANKLAAVLQSHGVTNGDAVCLFVKRSVEMLIGIVASLKIGACYVPQDVRLAPHETMIKIAGSTKSRVVLTLNQYVPTLPAFKEAQVIAIDSVMNEPPVAISFEGPIRPVKPSDRCYIIFTSGTTGAPKGVQVTHGNVSNVLLTEPMSLGMRPGLKVSQILSVSFDMGAWEILGCLSHGATLVIRGRNISHAIKHADVVVSTPTVLGTIDSSQMHHVRSVAVAGEPCPRPLAEEWGAFCTFYNSCGPTEVTIINTAKKFDSKAEILSIGKPTPNNTVYVLDTETRKPCKIGEVGEMWGGGDCVSRGYLNNDKLTKERYLPDPFINNGHGRMYRTGDLGRWTEDGELEHFGRCDDQVKVKGFRVELDGVSAMAEETEGVEKAIVLKVEESLVAFVTPANVTEEDVKESVKRKLPYYCIPSHVMCLNEVPKTGNGKVDKRALVQLLKKSKEIAQKASTETSVGTVYTWSLMATSRAQELALSFYRSLRRSIAIYTLS